MNPPSPHKIPLISRLASMLLDHAAMCFAMGILLAPVMVVTMFKRFSSNEPPDTGGIDTISLYLFPLAFAIYFAKDCIDGRSVAKRVLKFQVINAATGKTAGPIRSTIRNLSLVIWPLEVFLTLFNTSRRLGDWVAGTRVVYYDAQKSASPIKVGEIVIAIIVGYLFAFALVKGMDHFIFKAL